MKPASDIIYAPALIQFCQQNASCANPCTLCEVRALGICGALDADDLSHLQKLQNQMMFPAKGVLFAQGDRAAYVYTVTAGCVRLSKDMSDGRRQVVGFALPGDFLGLSPDIHHGFSADAVETVSLCRFQRSHFTKFLEGKPHLMERLYQLAVHELTIAQEQMLLLGRRRADEKIAAFLLAWRERLSALTGADQTLHLPMTRQDIADYLGLTIETVSRTFSIFARKKLIVIIPEGVRLMSVKDLRSLAG
jgi:CRP/FNR family transcriptional regulator, anaerobic regulatory protein